MLRNVCLTLLTLVTFSFVGCVIIHFWGRAYIYPENNSFSMYTALGQKNQHTDERLFIYPKGEGVPFQTTLDKRDKYSLSDYDVVNVPPQDYLKYAVGIVTGWEVIDDTDDKYLLLKFDRRGELYRYRIGFSASPLYDSDGKVPVSTRLSVEEVPLPFNWLHKDVSPQRYARPVAELGFDIVRRLVRTGDVVVVLPVFAPPEYAKKDVDGHDVISSLVVRRVGGLSAFLLEVRLYEK